MGKRLIYLFGMVTIAVIMIVYIDQRYFFNPVVFSQDHITTHGWNEYKHPLTLTYYSLDGERQAYQIKREEKIREWLQVLKDCPQADKKSVSKDIQGALKLSTPEETLLEILVYKKHWENIEGGNSLYQISQPLKRIVNQY